MIIKMFYLLKIFCNFFTLARTQMNRKKKKKETKEPKQLNK